MDRNKNQTAMESELEKVRAERDYLRARLEMLDEMLERLPAIVWYQKSKDGSLVYVSPEFERITGIPCSAILTDSGRMGEPVFKEDIAKVVSTFSENSDSEFPFNVEHRLVNQVSGQISWIRQRVLPVLDQKGQVKAQIGICIDITREKEVESLSLRMERQFAAVMENSSDLVLLSNPEGDAFYVNPAGVRILRCRNEEEVLSAMTPSSDLLPMEAKIQIYEAMSKNDFSGPLFFGIKRDDGTITHLEGSVTMIRDEEGCPAFAASILRDVTDRVVAYQAIQESESKLSAILHHSPIALCGFRADGRITLWNRAAEIVYGIEAEKAVGGYLWKLGLSWAESEILDIICKTFAGNALEPTEVRVVDSRGCERQVMRSSYPIATEKGEIFLGILGCVDITERKREEEERTRLQERLAREDRMESIGILAGGIAHDFNNLLVGILGNASLIEREVRVSERGGQCLNDLIVAAERAADLTRQLLAYARGGKYQPKLFDPNAVISEIVNLVRSGLPPGKELDVRLDTSIGWVEADRSQLQQVVTNLCVNAAESMKNGGKVILSTHQEIWRGPRESDFIVGEQRPGEWIVLRVTDSGSGMPREILEHVFDPFFSTKQMGRGLGLSAVAGIVTNHSGFMRVQTVVDKGSVFEVFLPISKDSPTREEHETDNPESSIPLILVVDDEELVRSLIARMLEKEGYEILGAADAEEAIRLLRRYTERLSLVIMDLSVSGLSRQDPGLIRRLREARPDLPILLTSGYDEKDVTPEMVREGIADFLAKPYPPGMLEEKVRDLLSLPTASSVHLGSPTGRI